MPTTAGNRPRAIPPDAQALNRRGLELVAAGAPEAAIALFDDAVRRYPEIPELHCNRAVALEHTGDHLRAADAYRAALRSDPDCLPALRGLAVLALRSGRYQDARDYFERLLRNRPGDTDAHWALYEIEQILGEPQVALDHQRAALARRRLYARRAPDERRRVLVLLAPGDWQANVPVDPLFDARTTTLHKLYVDPAIPVDPATLPPCDVVFVAIGQSDRAAPFLRHAEELAAALGRPVLNRPDRVAALRRETFADLFTGLEGIEVPRTRRIARDSFHDGRLPLDPPFIIRPLDAHAGHGLTRIERPGDLDDYLARYAATEFYVAPFVEYRSDDGWYRKYRFVAVGGTPFAYHLAISQHWMVHYYNAPMREHAWMRAEEERVLADPDGALGPAVRQRLAAMAARTGLDYVGFDIAIGRDGRIILFEADPAIIVHVADDSALFEYKRRYVPQIFAALERLVDERRVGSR